MFLYRSTSDLPKALAASLAGRKGLGVFFEWRCRTVY